MIDADHLELCWKADQLIAPGSPYRSVTAYEADVIAIQDNEDRLLAGRTRLCFVGVELALIENDTQGLMIAIDEEVEASNTLGMLGHEACFAPVLEQVFGQRTHGLDQPAGLIGKRWGMALESTPDTQPSCLRTPRWL